MSHVTIIKEILSFIIFVNVSDYAVTCLHFDIIEKVLKLVLDTVKNITSFDRKP